MQSCNNLRTSGLWHYVQAIIKYVRANPLVIEQINNYNYTKHNLLTYLSGRFEHFLDSTCCEQVSPPHLSVGDGLSLRNPKLLKWDCVNNTRMECGVEKVYAVSRYKILSKGTAEINVYRGY